LIDQLRDGGQMIVPVGERYQQTLYLFKKEDGKLVSTALLPTLFVPMTGKAEAGRAVLPDPANPTIVNGGFEDLVEQEDDSAGQGGTSEASPSGWHYQRQLDLVEDTHSPEGNRYARFVNTTAGRASRALQGMAIDGRKVTELEISLWVKAKDVQPGRNREEIPLLGIVFYDQNRAQAGQTWVGPWRGTFDWRQEIETIKVPAKAREAIVRIGLHGATGEICLDGIECKKK
jgi:protein-L-isoaspartate(D-aspartate) O-methyltransferase